MKLKKDINDKHVRKMKIRFQSNSEIMCRINQQRLPALRQHIERGGKSYLSLGCGSGEYESKLSDLTKRWIIGIAREEVPMEDSIRFTLQDYQCAERFYYLKGPYERVLEAWDRECQWMAGSALKTFMIMPVPKLFDEELALWLRFSVPKGELHVRTEDPDIITRLKVAIPRPWEEISFAKEALSISSTMTMLALGAGDTIHTFGFRLIV